VVTDRTSALILGLHGFGDAGAAWAHDGALADQRLGKGWGAGLHLGLGSALLRLEWARSDRGEWGWTFSEVVSF